MAILLVLLVNVFLLQDHVAQGMEDTCFSSAICYKAGVHEITWRKISPPPQCTRNSPTAESTNIIHIASRLEGTIHKFFKRIADNCQACSSFENDVSSATSFSDVERCFAPVICQTDGMSRTDFIQIQPSPICAKDKKEVDDILMEREKLFNASRDYVVTALQKHLEICNPGCLSNKIKQVAKQIEENNWKIHKGPKKCFAPVVCSAGDSSFQNWLKYPDCEYSTAILLSEEPENALSSILEVVFENIRKLIAEECNGKICKEKTMTAQSTVTTTQSTTKQGDKINHQTTFAIQQGASTRPETTIAFAEKMTTGPNTMKPTPYTPKATTDTRGPSTQPDTTTSFLEETTTVPKTSHPTTLAETTESLVSTMEIRVETSKETTTEKATTMTPTCGPLNKTNDCKIVYDHKCYTWDNEAQIYTLEMAKQWCERQGFTLGNIYDDCHYSYIMETVGKTRGIIWTGMNITFTSEGQRVLLRSGVIARFSEDWWYKEYPRVERGENLLITAILQFPHPALKTGITNGVGSQTADGAFCEKDIKP